jgi:hypothetical protein
MSDLKPPRSLLVTIAAILALATGLFWLAVDGSFLVWGRCSTCGFSGLRHALMIAVTIILICMSVATVIAGSGVLGRRNWARNLAIALGVSWILYGLWFLRPLVSLPASVIRGAGIAPLVLPFCAPIAWLLLLIGKRVRSEFLPPVMVQIYVNLLNEGTPCARPTQALILGNGLFELLPTKEYDPDVEHWEFRPGSIVRAEETHREGEPHLLATSFES